jgi:nucleoid DNA-binding protein
MSFLELVEMVSRDAGLPKTKVARILRSFCKVTKEVVDGGEKIVLTNFGVFYRLEQKERPMFGGERKTKRKTLVRFRESRPLGRRWKWPVTKKNETSSSP